MPQENTPPSIPPERELEYLENAANAANEALDDLASETVHGAETDLTKENIHEQIDGLLPDSNEVAAGAEAYLRQQDRLRVVPADQAAAAQAYEVQKAGSDELVGPPSQGLNPELSEGDDRDTRDLHTKPL